MCISSTMYIYENISITCKWIFFKRTRCSNVWSMIQVPWLKIREFALWKERAWANLELHSDWLIMHRQIRRDIHPAGSAAFSFLTNAEQLSSFNPYWKLAVLLEVLSDLWSMLLQKEGHNWFFGYTVICSCCCCPITAWIIKLISQSCRQNSLLP